MPKRRHRHRSSSRSRHNRRRPDSAENLRAILLQIQQEITTLKQQRRGDIGPAAISVVENGCNESQAASITDFRDLSEAEPAFRRSEADIENDFQYVVERVKPAKVCFGSGVPRSTDPVGKAGLSSFQRRYIGENFAKVHPQTYDLSKHSSIKQLLDKVRSNKGVGGLVSVVPRFPYKHPAHSHAKYDLGTKWGDVKESRFPFGSAIPRETMRIKSKTPGPGNYKIVDRKCFRTKFDYNFGRPKMIHAVPTYCVSKIIDTCDRCDLICQGDYWHRNFTNFFCQQCWEEENYFHKKYTKKEMKEFKKIRNCSFMHQHDGTTAAIRIKPWNKIFKQICVENYLDLFMKC